MTSGASIVVTYHYVRDTKNGPFPGIKALAVAEFEAQLGFVQSRFDVVALDAFEAALDGRRRPRRPIALLTFDDGFIDHYDTVFPILRRRGIPGLVFVAGAGIADPPRLLNVHREHFILARLDSKTFGAEVRREAASLGDQGAGA